MRHSVFTKYGSIDWYNKNPDYPWLAEYAYTIEDNRGFMTPLEMHIWSNHTLHELRAALRVLDTRNLNFSHYDLHLVRKAPVYDYTLSEDDYWNRYWRFGAFWEKHSTKEKTFTLATTEYSVLANED